MEVRLVQLLASFIRVSGDYALARLEFTMQHPDAQAPPLIERPPDASEDTLRRRWPEIERQLERARSHVKQFAVGGSKENEDPSTGWLTRTIRELDQYARAIRWVLTVTERHE
jgi:hypothetical protein